MNSKNKYAISLSLSFFFTAKVIQDVPTRWNSQFYMVRRLVALRVHVTAVLSQSKDKNHRNLALSGNQWSIAEDLVAVLCHLETATTVLSGEQYPTLSLLLPMVIGLRKQLDPVDNDKLLIADLKESLQAQLTERFSLESLNPSGILVLASAVDPRFRNLSFLNDAQRKEAEAALVARTSADGDGQRAESGSGDSDVSIIPAKADSSAAALDALLGFSTSTHGSVEEEVSTYLAERAELRSCNPLQWWKANSARSPCIAAVAKEVSCIPATSTPAERVFSTAGLIVNNLRNKLSGEMVESLVFLNKNRTFLGIKTEPTPKEPQLFEPPPGGTWTASARSLISHTHTHTHTHTHARARARTHACAHTISCGTVTVLSFLLCKLHRSSS